MVQVLKSRALLALVLLLTLTACSQTPLPQGDQPVVIKPPGTDNEYLLAVGELEPTFGGLFLTGNTLNIYLLNADTATQAEKDSVVRSLRRVYGDDLPGLAGTPRFLRGDYSMVDLYAWYSKLGALFEIPELTFTDLDEGRNRLAVGVVDLALEPEVQRRLTDLAIPLEAVIIEETGYVCAGPGWSSIAVEVRDQGGEPAAIGASVTLQKADYEATQIGYGDPLQIFVGESVGGTFDVTVSKPYYEGARVEGVEVATDECGYGETVTVEVTLTLKPDAPAVRQVVVSPYGIGLGGGYSVQEVAYVEAAEGVSRDVTWHSEDEAVATVTADGTITGVCSEAGGETLVTATSVADPSKSASLEVSVMPVSVEPSGCP